MRQIIVFKTLDELHAYAEKSHSHIRFEFESDDVLLVKMHNESIAKLNYSSVTWNNDGLETYMINWWNVEKFEFLFWSHRSSRSTCDIWRCKRNWCSISFN